MTAWPTRVCCGTSEVWLRQALVQGKECNPRGLAPTAVIPEQFAAARTELSANHTGTAAVRGS